jgi:hypothetical protein
MPTFTFSVGDRVAEKPRPGDHVFTEKTANLKTVRYYATTRRIGRVTSTTEKRSSTGARIRYVEVIWDGQRSPSLHAASRLSILTPDPCGTLGNS